MVAIPLKPTLRQSYWVLVGLGGLYLAMLGLLTNGWVQRQALYAHRVGTAGWWHDLGQPEKWGFLPGQVQAARIGTPDGESLYGWHVLPVGAYTRHEAALLSEREPGSNGGQGDTSITPAERYEESRAFRLLRDDQDAKLILNFHGNAGHVGQGWRTDTYQSLVAADSEHAHVFSFDYRGFGHSSGVPTEHGLIRDGVAVVRWFLDRGIPQSRIVLVGNSLGVGISIATAQRLQEESGVELRGLVLVAGFSDLTTLMATYAIGHAIPVFSPLRPYPKIQAFFENRILDKWDNVGRMYDYVKASDGVNIALIHARNDYDIPWTHSIALFHAAANATSTEGMSFKDIEVAAEKKPLVRGGVLTKWRAEGRSGKLKKITATVIRDGGHNRIMTFALVTKSVIDCFRS